MMRAVIAIVAVLVVVAGIVVMQQRGDATAGGKTPGSNTADNPHGPVEIVKAETHVIECNEPDYLEDKFPDKEGNMITVLEKGQAVEGDTVTFLRSPKYLKQCGLDEADDPIEKGKKIKEIPGKLPGLAVYNFEVQLDWTFYVFLNAKWTDTCGNSCYILMNGPEKGSHDPKADFHSLEDQLGFITNTNYKAAWHPLNAGGKLKKFELKKGMNRIELHTREDGPTFYQFVVTTEASTPVGAHLKKKS